MSHIREEKKMSDLYDLLSISVHRSDLNIKEKWELINSRMGQYLNNVRRFDTGHQYDPLLIRHDLSSDKGVYLDDNQLSNAKSEYSLICVGSASRYPLWQHKTSGEFIGGFYESIASQDTLIALYQAFKKEMQIIGYEESKNGKWGQSKNPFPPSLSGNLPRHVWAKSYEKGSRVHREERHINELKARNEIKGE